MGCLRPVRRQGRGAMSEREEFIGAAWDAVTAILAGIVLLGSLLALAI